MRMFVGVTDWDWYRQLSELKPDEVNFWKPSGRTQFQVLEPNGLFLFKLHHPRNFIVGGGFFVHSSLLPVSLAWEAFQEKNGTRDRLELLDRIIKYRGSQQIEPDPVITCIVLTQPFWFEQNAWIPVPPDWSSNIVQGKTYTTDNEHGIGLYQAVNERLRIGALADRVAEQPARYGEEVLVRPRLGQGAFRVLVTEAYSRRCAITGEKTLPVLEAAHIKPFSLQGPNEVTNGLLLRSDLHTLFDLGFLTVTPEHVIEVSKEIKHRFENGREYYAYHGSKVKVLPSHSHQMPSKENLKWHNENVFVA